METAEAFEDVKCRVNTLIDCVTYSTFNYISRGLFERDKLTFTAQLAFQVCVCVCVDVRDSVGVLSLTVFTCFQLLLMSKEIDARELDFLLRFNIDHTYVSQLDFLSNSAWSAIKVPDHICFSYLYVYYFGIHRPLSAGFWQVMSFTDEFKGLDRDIEGSPKRWKKLVESECPEKERFPQEWKGKSSLQKLIMMRALRPDRMTYALKYCCELSFNSISGVVFVILTSFFSTLPVETLWKRSSG